MSDDERAFSLGPKFFADLRRSALSRGFPVLVVALAVVLLMDPPGTQVESSTRLFVACTLVAVALFGGWRGYKRQESSLRGFTLFVGRDRLRRVQPGLPEIEIYRSEVVRIAETHSKGLMVHAAGHQNFIGVPSGLNGFEEVRELLASWCAIEERRAALAHWYPALFGALTVVAFGLVMGSGNRQLVTTLGVALFVAMLYSLVILRRSPHIDTRVKKTVWFIPIIILTIALRIWMVWHP